MDVVYKTLPVSRHAKKIVLFRYLFRRHLVIRTFAVHQLFSREETLAAFAVMTGIFGKVYITVIIHLLQYPLYRGDMILIRGSNEIIRCNFEKLPGAAKHITDIVSILLRLLSLLVRRIYNFIAMLIRARLETNAVTAEPAKTAIGVCNDSGIGMAKVRLGVHIIYRCCNISSH